MTVYVHIPEATVVLEVETYNAAQVANALEKAMAAETVIRYVTADTGGSATHLLNLSRVSRVEVTATQPPNDMAVSDLQMPPSFWQ